MGTGVQDVRLQSLFLGGVPIPLGGDGVSARIVFGTLGTVVRGVATSIKQVPNVPEAKLTVTVYPHDPGYAILKTQVAAQRLPGAGLVKSPGSALNTGTGDVVTWGDCQVATRGDVALGTAVETVSFEFDLIDVVSK